MTESLIPADPVPTPAPRSGPAPTRSYPLRLLILGGLVVMAGVGGGWPLLVMIAALFVMITLHELGHYLTAKWAGMKVTEFFIGFGPRIWSTRRGETEYGLKVVPLGAYVKIVGMHNLDEYDPADNDRTYLSKPFWRRLSVAVAGSTMHFLLALVCFVVAFTVVGTPAGQGLPTTRAEADALESRAEWSIDDVRDGSAADGAGVEVGDRVVAVDGEAVDTFNEFGNLVEDRPGEDVSIDVLRDGRTFTVEATLGDDDGRGVFGIVSRFDVADVPVETVGLADGLRASVSEYGDTVGETLSGLAHILSPTGLSDLGRNAFGSAGDGPAVTGGSGGASPSASREPAPRASGIIGISDLGTGLLDGGHFGYFLLVFAAINIFIGIFNLVPLLPLDGGHVVIAVYEKVRSMLQGGRPYHVDVVKLLPVTYAAVVVLVFLGVSTIVSDIRVIGS